MKYTTWTRENFDNVAYHLLKNTGLVILHAKSARQSALVGIRRGQFLLYKKVGNAVENIKTFHTLTDAKDFAESYADLYVA
jgi:hypothetical protein